MYCGFVQILGQGAAAMAAIQRICVMTFRQADVAGTGGGQDGNQIDQSEKAQDTTQRCRRSKRRPAMVSASKMMVYNFRRQLLSDAE